MNIRDEFERFRAFTSTEEGFRQVEERWWAQSNYEKRADGRWYKTSVGDGDLAGFAIDPKTLRFKIGQSGQDHDDALSELIRELFHEACDMGDPVDRVLKGRIAYLPEWRFPIVCLIDPMQPLMLAEIEEQILNLGIGLPYASICCARVFRKK